MTTTTSETDSKGVPLKSPFPPAFQTTMLPFLITIYVVFGTIGLMIAYYWAYKGGKSSSETIDSRISTIIEYDLGYIYAGFVILSFVRTIILKTLFVTTRLHSKIHNPDQHVYKVQDSISDEGANKLGYVLMETQGILGKFNRAQRAYQNYNETFPNFIFMWLLCSWVFPLESFVCLVLWIVARIYYNVLYIDGATKRDTGTAVAETVEGIVHGMCVIITLKSLMFI